MAPEFRIIPGDLPPLPPKGSEFSPFFIRELAQHVDPKDAEATYAGALDRIATMLRSKIRSDRSEAIDIMYDAVANAALFRDDAGNFRTDYEAGVRKLVAGAARRTGENWKKKLADEIVAVYLGDGPDGTTIGAMKLSKRAASGGGP